MVTDRVSIGFVQQQLVCSPLSIQVPVEDRFGDIFVYCIVVVALVAIRVVVFVVTAAATRSK